MPAVKPSRMHWSTFHRLAKRIAETEGVPLRGLDLRTHRGVQAKILGPRTWLQETSRLRSSANR